MNQDQEKQQAESQETNLDIRDLETIEFDTRGLLVKGRKPGQSKPQTPSGEVKPWQPPTGETTPANRKDDG